jgi:hypothetical protein
MHYDVSIAKKISSPFGSNPADRPTDTPPASFAAQGKKKVPHGRLFKVFRSRVSPK